MRAGYYCIDTFTPLNRNAYLAARARRGLRADRGRARARRPARWPTPWCARPATTPSARAFGGFCYFNNAAIAAHYLSRYGRVAILDIDYHHGNGTQDIFYERGDVLTVSIHGHPRFAYPYFTGFADETGEGAGQGFNLNLPLPETIDGAGYREALERALRARAPLRAGLPGRRPRPRHRQGDPTGTWPLRRRRLHRERRA